MEKDSINRKLKEIEDINNLSCKYMEVCNERLEKHETILEKIQGNFLQELKNRQFFQNSKKKEKIIYI